MMYSMKICVAAEGDFKNAESLPECDLAVFGFNALGCVDYERELAGKSEKFEALARLSRSAKCGVVCGCFTDSRGLRRKSAAVADRGRLLGISDMLHTFDGDGYKSGANLGVYTVGGFKVGVCVENDLYFPENIKALALCGCNLVSVLMEEVNDGMPPLLVRAYAYLYGLPAVMCAGKLSYFADITGEMASSNQKVTLFETCPRNCYRLVTTRRRGLWDDPPSDY